MRERVSKCRQLVAGALGAEIARLPQIDLRARHVLLHAVAVEIEAAEAHAAELVLAAARLVEQLDGGLLVALLHHVEPEAGAGAGGAARAALLQPRQRARRIRG